MHTNISLQQLRYIIEVAECGSINAASQQLYVSQPTLSATIKDTEQELGISIFNRTNRGITLTNEGTEFIGYARQILATPTPTLQTAEDFPSHRSTMLSACRLS